MSRCLRLTLAGGIVLAGLGGAEAQTSLFDPPAATAPAATQDVAPKAKAKPKRKRPSPARRLTVTNVSGSAVTSLEVTADGKTAKLGKALANDGTATLKLPAFKSCTVTVVASFEGPGEPERLEQNICKDRKLRLTSG